MILMVEHKESQSGERKKSAVLCHDCTNLQKNAL